MEMEPTKVPSTRGFSATPIAYTSLLYAMAETVPPLITISPYLYLPSPIGFAPPPPVPIAAPGCLPAFVTYPPQAVTLPPLISIRSTQPYAPPPIPAPPYTFLISME